MFERDISEDDVETIIKKGTIIEPYPSDQPYPSYLILGFIKHTAIHVVYAKYDEDIIVITAYKPDLKKWESDYKARRK